MAVYVEYERYKHSLSDVQTAFDRALIEKERLFTKTQPNAVRYDRDAVQVSHGENYNLETYVIESEKIDKELNIYREILVDRERLLTLKEKELRASKEKHDRVYTLYYLDGYGVNKAMKTLGYSKAQFYRIFNTVQSTLQNMLLVKNETK